MYPKRLGNGSGSSCWSAFVNAIGIPLITKIWFVVALATFASGILAARSYQQYHAMAVENHIKWNAIHANCINQPEWVARAQKEHECRDAIRNKDIWPSVTAFFDLMEDWQLCGRYGCVQTLDGITSSTIFRFIFVVCSFWFVFMFATGIMVRQENQRLSREMYELPGSTSASQSSSYGLSYFFNSPKVKNVEFEEEDMPSQFNNSNKKSNNNVLSLEDGGSNNNNNSSLYSKKKSQ